MLRLCYLSFCIYVINHHKHIAIYRYQRIDNIAPALAISESATRPTVVQVLKAAKLLIWIGWTLASSLSYTIYIVLNHNVFICSDKSVKWVKALPILGGIK